MIDLSLQFFGGRGGSSSGTGSSMTHAGNTPGNLVAGNMSSAMRSGSSSKLSETLSDMRVGDSFTVTNTEFNSKGESVAKYKMDVTVNKNSFSVSSSKNGGTQKTSNKSLRDMTSTLMNYKSSTGGQNNIMINFRRNK